MHSADNWHSVLEPVVARYRDVDIRRYFRGGADSSIADDSGRKRASGIYRHVYIGTLELWCTADRWYK